MINRAVLARATVESLACGALFLLAFGYDGAFFNASCVDFERYGLYLSDGTGIFYDSLVVAEGGIPGRDISSLWGAWVYYFHALFLWQLGPTLSSLKVAYAILDGLHVVLFYGVLRFFFSTRPAFLLALPLLLFNHHVSWWNHGYVSFAVSLLLWAALWLLLHWSRTGRPFLLVGAGVVLGFAFGWKFSYAIAGWLGALCFVLLQTPRGGPARSDQALLPGAAAILGGLGYCVMGGPALWALPAIAIGSLLIIGYVRSDERDLRSDAVAASVRNALLLAIGIAAGVAPLFAFYWYAAGLELALTRLNPRSLSEAGQAVTGVFIDVRMSSPHVLADLIGLTKDRLQPWLAFAACIGYVASTALVPRLKRAPFVAIWIALAAIFSAVIFASWSGLTVPMPLQPTLCVMLGLLCVQVFRPIRGELPDTAQRLRHPAIQGVALYAACLVLNNFPGTNYFTFAWGCMPGVVLVGAYALAQSYVGFDNTPRRANLTGCLWFVLFVYLADLCGRRTIEESFDIRESLYVYNHVGGEFAYMPEPYDVIVKAPFATEMKKLVRYLEDHGKPGEQLISLNGFPMIYGITRQMPPAIRHTNLRAGDLTASTIAEISAEITSHKTAWLVRYLNDGDWVYGSWGLFQHRFPAFTNMIESRYKPVLSFGHFELLRRK